MPPRHEDMKLISPGDGEGFVAAFVNNLVQLLILAPLCVGVLGFSPALVYGRILPGVAVSFLVGNLFYAWQALALARREGRDDVTALPYGISTPGLFAHVFLVMLPARQLALAQGIPDPERFAWHAGLVACFLGGLLEFGCSFFAASIRRHTPQAAMLATLAGVGLGFLGLAFLFQIFAAPVVGLVTLTLVFIVFFGRVRIRGGLPATFVVLAVGTALAWLTGLAPVGGPNVHPLADLHLYFPWPVPGELLAALGGGHIVAYLSVVIPIGLLGVLASLQNIESAAAAGDEYPVRASLIVNGLGTLAGALFGSPFPTSIYIGHPAWKKLGARAGYSVLNGAAITFVCLTGSMAALTWLIPAEAGVAIILWIGIIITAQAFEVTPRRHLVAVVVGTLSGHRRVDDARGKDLPRSRRCRQLGWRGLAGRAPGAGGARSGRVHRRRIRAGTGISLLGDDLVGHRRLHRGPAVGPCGGLERNWRVAGAGGPHARLHADRTRHRHRPAAARLARRSLAARTLFFSRRERGAGLRAGGVAVPGRAVVHDPARGGGRHRLAVSKRGD